MGRSRFRRSYLEMGIDGAGKDILAHGITSGAYLKWDAATDTLYLVNANFDIVGDVEIEGDLTLTTEDISVIQGRRVYLAGQDSDEYISSEAAGYTDIEAATAIRPGADLLTDRWQNSVTNVFIGMGVCGAGGLAAAGLNNVAIGNEAMYSIAGSKQNVAVGFKAMYNQTAGHYNVAVGYMALYEAEGSRNTAVGYQALKTMDAGTGANWNTALGSSALEALTTGTCNVGLGARAGYVMTTGANNILIGYTAGDNITTADNCIIIGHAVDAPSVSVDAQIKIGGSTATQGYILGDSDGDMTINAIDAKNVHLAVADIDVVSVGSAVVAIVQPTTVTLATGTGVHSAVTAVAEYTGWALGYWGQAIIKNTAGNAANAAGGCFEVNVHADHTGGKSGIWAGIYVGCFANSATAGSIPTAGIYIENIAGADIDMSDVPMISLVTSGAGGSGKESAIAFEFGNAEAVKWVSTGTGGMWQEQTIRCVINGTAYFMPISSVEGTYTTDYLIQSALATDAESTTTGAVIIAGGVGIGGKLYGGSDVVLRKNTGAATNSNGIWEILTINEAVTGSVSGIRCLVITDEVSARTPGNIFGGNFSVRLLHAGDKATGLLAGVQVTVDLGAANQGIAAYGMNIDFSENVTRQTPPRAFIAFGDYDHGGNHPCVSLFDLGGSGSICSTGDGELAYHDTLHIILNTDDKWIPLSNAQGSYTTPYKITSTYVGTEAIYQSQTQVSATPGTVRAIYGKNTSYSSMTTGMLVGVRGEVVLAGNVTNVHLCGVQGKIVTGAHSVNHATAYIAAVFGQLDLSDGTLTMGKIAGVAADIYGCTEEGRVYSYLNGMYVEHAGGATINSYFKGFGKTTYVFDFESNLDDTIGSTGTVTATAGWLQIRVKGVTRFIPLGAARP